MPLTTDEKDELRKNIYRRIKPVFLTAMLFSYILGFMAAQAFK